MSNWIENCHKLLIDDEIGTTRRGKYIFVNKEALAENVLETLEKQEEK